MGQFCELLSQIKPIERMFAPQVGPMDHKAAVEQALRDKGEEVTEDPKMTEKARIAAAFNSTGAWNA